MSVILKRLHISIILEGLSVIKMEGRGRERGGGIEMIERDMTYFVMSSDASLSSPSQAPGAVQSRERIHSKFRSRPPPKKRKKKCNKPKLQPWPWVPARELCCGEGRHPSEPLRGLLISV